MHTARSNHHNTSSTTLANTPPATRSPQVSAHGKIGSLRVKGRQAAGFIRSAIALALCAVASQSMADTVYVSLEKENALAVVDGLTGTLKRTVPLGRRPRGLAFSPDYARLYVATSDDNAIVVLDSNSLSVLGRLPAVPDPKTFALSPDGKRVFVSNDDDQLLSVIDIEQNRIVQQIAVGKEPEGVTVSPDGHWVISTSESANLAQWLDTQSLTIQHRSAVAARPRASRFSDDGQQLWVSSEQAGALTVIDTASRQIIQTLHFAPADVQAELIKPVDIRIDRNRQFAYVALGRANRVAVVDAQRLAILGYIEVGKRVWHLEFSPDQQRLYAANGLSDDLSIIDLAQRKTIKTVALGQSPWGVAVKP